MSFVDNAQLKSALVTEIKSHAAITTLLATAQEVREVDWQGDQFGYPNVRIRVIENKPFGSCYSDASVGIQVFSEQKSSEEAEHISGIIGRELQDRYFNHHNVAVHLRLTNLLPAARTDALTWRTEAIFKAIVSSSG